MQIIVIIIIIIIIIVLVIVLVIVIVMVLFYTLTSTCMWKLWLQSALLDSEISEGRWSLQSFQNDSSHFKAIRMTPIISNLLECR